MRKFLYFFLIYSTALFAQREEITLADTAASSYDEFAPTTLDTFEFEGKTYSVYPYILEAPYIEPIGLPERKLSKKEIRKIAKQTKKEYDDDYEYASEAVADSAVASSYQWDEEVPPTAYTLTKGNYVILQMQNNGTRAVRATFSLEDGVPHGQAIFYKENQQISKDGFYKNGLKDSTWNHYQYLNNVAYKSFYNYTEGLKHGRYEEYIVEEVAYVSEKGIYNYDDLIENEEYNSLHTLKSKSSKDSTGNTLVKEYYEESGNLKSERYYNFISYYGAMSTDNLSFCDDKLFTQNFDDCELSVPLPIGGYAKYYYKNGVLLGEFSAEYYENEPRLHFDTLYNPKGAILATKKNISDSLDIPRFEICIYDIQGKLKVRNRYISNSENLSPYESIVRNTKGELQIHNARYKNFYNKAEKKNDELYLYSVKTKDRIGYIQYEYVMPQFRDGHFIKIYALDNSYSVDFNITNKDSNSFNLQTTVAMGDAKVVLYSRKDTSYHYSRRDYSLSTAINKMFKMDKKLVRDSVKFYYKDKLFSGNMHLFFGNGKRLLHFKKGRIALDLLAIEQIKKEIIRKSHSSKKKKQREEDFAKSSIDLNFKDGEIINAYVHFFEKREEFEAKGSFENSALNGTQTIIKKRINKSGNSIDSKKIEVQFKNGRMHGKLTEYVSNNGDTWVLNKMVQHCNEHPCDSSIEYHNGKIQQLSLYNEAGELHGTSFSYFENGKLEYSRSYKNGLVDSITLYFDENGDTTKYYNYLNGVEEGRFIELTSEYSNEYFRVEGYYHEGKPVGKLMAKDKNNLVRLTIDIVDAQRHTPLDENHVRQDIYSEEHNYFALSLKDWFETIQLGGKVQLFYTNGIKYCEGETKLKPQAITDIPEIANEENYYPDGVAPADSVTVVAAEPTATWENHSNYSVTSICNSNMCKKGLWNYYGADGKVRFQINYIDSSFIQLQNEKKYGCAQYKEFYPNGKVMAMGLLLNESAKQDCESDLPELDFTVLYTDFFSEEGKVLMKNNQGIVKQFHNNQVVSTEGKMMNGKKEGWWKEYNKEGKLIFVGKFVDGYAYGRHLRGDLEGINYLDDRCFESIQAQQEAIKETQYYLEIEETFYENGIQVSSNNYSFKRAK